MKSREGGVGDETGGAAGGEIGPGAAGLEGAASQPFGYRDWSVGRLVIMAGRIVYRDSVDRSQPVREKSGQCGSTEDEREHDDAEKCLTSGVRLTAACTRPCRS